MWGDADPHMLAATQHFGPFVLQCPIGAAVEAPILSKVIESIGRPVEPGSDIMAAIICWMPVVAPPLHSAPGANGAPTAP